MSLKKCCDCAYTVKNLRVKLHNKTGVNFIKSKKIFNPSFWLKNSEILKLIYQKVGVRRIYHYSKNAKKVGMK